MISLLTACVICGTVLILWYQAAPFVARIVAVMEANARQQSHAPILADEPMPEWAKAVIFEESEAWAQADTHKLLTDYYKQTHSWEQAVARVRQAREDAPIFTGVLLS